MFAGLIILALLSCPLSARLGFESSASEKEVLPAEVPTQGEYAIEWAEKLGLGRGLSEQEAIGALTEVGIEPKDGWQPTFKVTPEFLTEVFDLILDAVQKGHVQFQPESAVTQGAFAVELLHKLRLSEKPVQEISTEEAITGLSSAGIAPAAGWEPDAKADVDFLTDITTAAVEAARKETLFVSPEEAYDIVTSLVSKLRVLREITPPMEIEPGVGVPRRPRPVAPTVEEEESEIEKLLAGRAPFVVSTKLKQFGYEVFEQKVSTFAPVKDVPVGPDYVVGPGDKFTVTLWGRVNAVYNVEVGRSGEITLPEVGVLNVSGMSFTRLQEYLQDQFSRKFTDFKMNVSMRELRTIRVFIVGEAIAPGTYTVSSLSSVINALMMAGGPSKQGTLRNIRLTRGANAIQTIDLYNFLMHGDKSEDVRLQSGDTIFIPVIGPVVGVAGNVKRPAIYEMKAPLILADVLDLAGGVTHAGWLQRVQVERVQNHEKRIIVDFDMSSEAMRDKQKHPLQTSIQDGDVVKVFPVLPPEQNVVYLEGHVYRPGKYELKPGMHLRDILSSYEVLQKQANLEYGEIERLVEPDYHPVVISFNPGKVLEADESENIELARFDTIRIFRWDKMLRRVVSVSGQVHRPGQYRLVPDMKVVDLINAAGGLRKNAYLKTAEITRRHVSQSGMQTEKIDIELEEAIGGGAEQNIALQDYDHLVVRPIPELEFDRVATVAGEVKFPGIYPTRRGETLSSVIERAGGFTDRAYLRAAVFTRESAKAVQKERLEQLVRKMEEETLSRAERSISGALSEEQAKTEAQLAAAQKELLTKLRTAKVEGRVVIRLSQMEKFKGSEYDVELEDGDKLVIPERPGVVNVVGEVYNPTALLYEESRTVAYYLSKVGGPTDEADNKHLSVVRADGSVISMSQKKLTSVAWDSENKRWFFGDFMSVSLNPGDTIVVPRKMDRYAWLRNTRDITQVMFQIAVAAGVVIAAM